VGLHRGKLSGRWEKKTGIDPFERLVAQFMYRTEVAERLLAFERRYEQSASPFERRFTRDNLALLMKKLAGKVDYQRAA
jgi:hypothetical protein